ncbi:hypothetical protein Back11_36860 [Paenibacillus baekrokdamisoli]|uniref:PPM-type phosphatase domain-containing protein n=1 Tax=Paenibacillus baekrokdamisoli TaxID=1712516 RepID=A0A3G9J931_9BACL|nr:protein phosphatase 2C domain-containing protein [Paenibacillus baekrokdamisoli]MBB3072607.1 hypothetical protein [Paenibacillus baekrokdamisoli]BBH22341.1 hypothetical protein Back11_36860 [Paenibacillus baekrokdamisoli]
MPKNISVDFSVESSTQKGISALNEDALVLNANKQVYGVIDGVSSIEMFLDHDQRTGGYIAAQLVASHLHVQSKDINIREAVLAANVELRQRMEAEGIDVTCSWKLWSAVFAVVQIHPTYMEYVQCGDCMLFVQYNDQSIRVLTRNQVEAFDTRILNKKQELIELGHSKEDIQLQLFPLTESNRNKANTLEGYSVMNGDPAFADFLEYGRISRANVSKVYAVTDGLFHHIEASDDPQKWDKFIMEINKKGLEHYMDHLTCIEEQDPFCIHFPRHKKSDDKSAVIMEFQSGV